MKKKMYVLILAVLLVSSLLCACGSSDTEDSAAPGIMLSTEPVETTAATTAPTEEAQPTETTAPEETTEPSTEPTEAETEPAETTAQHSHSYTKSVVAATCTAKGYTLNKCKTCTYSYKSNQTAALGHSYKDEVVAPTTSAEGYTLHTCKTCGYSYKDNYKNKLDSNTGNTNTGSNNNHTHSYSSSVTAPTCTEKGYTTYTCKTCNYSYKGNYTDKAAHKLEYSFTDPAGCDKTDVGYDCYACTVCGYCEHRNTVPSTGMHEWGQWARTKEPTTSETGVETRVCALCKTTETRTVDKLPAEPHTHSYTSKVTASTCTEEGYTTYTCKTCNYSYKGNYTDKTAHKLEYSFTDPAGCDKTDVGYDCYACVCGYCEHRNTVPSTGMHEWGQWTQTKEPTTSETGVETRVCALCKTTETRTIDKLPAGTHTCSYTSTVVTAPTCTENGYTTYTCFCGDSYTGNETNATGHAWGEWTRTKEPTTSEYGEESRSCTCGETESREVEKLAESHTHSYTEDVINPTCTTGGYITFTCACGDSYTGSETDAAGHSWGDWEITVEATTESEGTKVRTCSICGETESQQIDKKAPAATSDNIYDLVNAARAENGLSPLTYYAEGQQAADIRVAEIAQYFSHTRPDGSDCFTIQNELGLSMFLCGENIAVGYQTNSAVMNGWMNSPGHRANILSGYFTHIAVATDGCYWVMLFFAG